MTKRDRNILGRLSEEAVGENVQLLPANRSARKPGRINLRAVSEVLASKGMDPTEQILKVLAPTDKDGNELPCKLDEDVQARLWGELLQYTQPKLKSVEVRAKVAATAFDVTDAQAARIAQEFLARGFAEADLEDDE